MERDNQWLYNCDDLRYEGEQGLLVAIPVSVSKDDFVAAGRNSYRYDNGAVFMKVYVPRSSVCIAMAAYRKKFGKTNRQ